MKLLKMLFLSAAVLTGIFLACSESTDPEPFDESEVVEAMQEADQILGGILLSDGYSAVTQMPEGSTGSGKRSMPDISRITVADSTDEVDDLLLILLSAFLPKGTYTNTGADWNYSAVPDDEIVFIYSYADSTGQPHACMWRYYDISHTDTLEKASFELSVDGDQLIGFTIEIKGTVTVSDHRLQPVIESVVVEGFIKSDEGIQYNINITLTESEMTLTLAEEGNPPLIIDLSGELGFAKKDFPQSLMDWNAEWMIVNYGQLEIASQDLDQLISSGADGSYGMIKWKGNKVADLVLIGGVSHIKWDDGRLVPHENYKIHLGSGEII